VADVILTRFSISCFKSVTKWEELALPPPKPERNFIFKITTAEVQAVTDNAAPSAVKNFHLSNLSFTLKNE
jgi:hypothetical protein